MKQFVIVAASLMMALPALAQQKIQPGVYEIDAAHSKVGFEIPHLVISTVEGRFTKYAGSIDLKEKFDASKVDATVEVESIDTSVGKRDEHLRSADFFDTKKFPKITFKSTGITGTPDNFKMTGDLTIRGVTKKVVFDGKYLGSVQDGFGQQKVAFDAKTKINRKDFGLTWNKMVEAGPTVGDEVTLSLKIQAAQKAVAKK
ncbi:MAG: YceI family protein [Bdellovibrionaceae bacterium]|nr:YceI family protein [Pseudobdellovibrionaceae bacterium]MBX3034602.1 YceI family protein [Pseudobdellovibrionaceae bacterium]